MQLMGGLGVAQALTEATLNGILSAVLAHEGDQLGMGAAGMAQSRGPQWARTGGGLAGSKQAIVDMANCSAV